MNTPNIEMVLLTNPFYDEKIDKDKNVSAYVVISCSGLDEIREKLTVNPPPGGVELTMKNARVLSPSSDEDCEIVLKAIMREPHYLFINRVASI